MIEQIPTVAQRADDAILFGVVFILFIAFIVWLWIKGAPDNLD